MPDYVITLARSARKELEALDQRLVRRIFPKIEKLTKDPRPKGCRKLQGQTKTCGAYESGITEFCML